MPGTSRLSGGALSLAFVAAITAVGCDAGGRDPVAPGGDPTFKSEVALAALLPAGAELVGVAATPEGQRYVLDRRSGLYLLGRGTATPVFKTSELATRYGQPAELDLTDVAALGSERFALTAENDGFLLNLYGGTFTSYFCYLPSLDPAPTVVPPTISQALRAQGIAVKERTESVAFSAETGMLFAQPQTFRLDTGALAGAELFVFTQGGGAPVQVRAMPDAGFVAGGMVALDGQRLLLGRGNVLYEMTEFAGPAVVRELDSSIRIAGMAHEADGDLLLLDAAGQRLLEMATPARLP